MVTFWDELAQAISSMLADAIPPANVTSVTKSLHGLTALAAQAIPTQEEIGMTAPDPTNTADQVSISQAWLEFVATTVTTANSVLGPYIQQLIAGEAVQLQPADVADVESALTGLKGLEPSVPPVTPPAGP